MAALAKTKILVVCEGGLFRGLLARALAGEASLEVVGTASDSQSALRLFQELKPDVVLTSISPPCGLNGVELGQMVKKDRPQTGVVVLASSKHRHLLASTLPVEGSGWCYLLEESVTSIPVLVRAIESTAVGLMIMDSKLVTNRRAQESTGVSKLSSALRAVLELMAQGYNNGTIAQKLAPLAEKSVENYVSHVYSELGISRAGPWHPRVMAVLQYLQETQDGGLAQGSGQGPSPPQRGRSRKRPNSGN